ncbi:peptidase S33 family protein [Pleurotus pulmonarius]
MSRTSATPFKIAVSDDVLNQLKAKLDLATFPDELDDADWDYGTPLKDVKRLVDRWRNGYDWREHEAKLNAELPQFTRDIEVDGHGTLNVHYVHQKSSNEKAIPLLFVHGWPGSFIEVRKILPLLTKGSEGPSFHVVAVGLPGFGFSEAPKKKGFSVPQHAEVGHKLMLSLGYNEYVAQGGDWGTLITRHIASEYGGKACKAWHTNIPIGSPPHPVYQPLSYLRYALTPYKPHEKAGLERSAMFALKGFGYFAIQSTRPQTLGYGLADSPIALLAWIYEKLVAWTDDYPWEDDEVLTWVSIYLFSRSGPTASTRIYYEAVQKQHFGDNPLPKLPTGFSYFPQDIVRNPISWTFGARHVVYQKEHDKGGHFAAHERPDDLVGDLREMFGKKGPCFGVVPGKDGY